MKRRRRIRRTLFLCVSLSLALWRLPTMIETFNQKISSGDSGAGSVLSAMGAAAGSHAAKKPKHPTNSLVVIPAMGRTLTPGQRSQLMGEARDLAPISYNHPSAPAANTTESVDPSDQANEASPTVEQLRKQAEKTLRDGVTPH